MKSLSLSATIVASILGLSAGALIDRAYGQPTEATSSAVPISQAYCAVRVANSEPTAADVWDTRRLFDYVFNIPGLPGPVFTPFNRRGEWTIDASHSLVRYSGPYPRSPLNRDHVTEPWSGRTVAVTSGTADVSVLTKDTDRFKSVPGLPKVRGGGLVGPFLMPRAKLTVVTIDGEAFIVDEQSFRPWPLAASLFAQGSGGIVSIHDASTIGGTIVVDVDRRMHVVSDDGHWTMDVARLDKGYYGRVLEVPPADAVLFMANHSVIAFRKGGAAEFTAETIVSASTSGVSFPYLSARQFGDVFHYAAGGWFDSKQRWRRLRRKGWEDVPGGDVGVFADLHPHGSIKDLSSIGRTLVRGRNGLFLYDGNALLAVADSGEARIGRWWTAYDLPSIGRALISSREGLFEITQDGRLVALSMPFAVGGDTGLEDWPIAGAAVISTRDGMFVLDRDLGAHRVLQPGVAYVPSRIGENPATGDLMVIGREGLWLLVDVGRRGKDACVTAPQ